MNKQTAGGVGRGAFLIAFPLIALALFGGVKLYRNRERISSWAREKRRKTRERTDEAEVQRRERTLYTREPETA